MTEVDPEMDPATTALVVKVLTSYLPFEGSCGNVSLVNENGSYTFRVVISPRNEAASDEMDALQDGGWSWDLDGSLVYGDLLPEEVESVWQVACALVHGEKPHHESVLRRVVKAFGL